ncbi:hypothetical protein N7497_012284 [Penicillium chrysogenum]|nr:hypothetical protein N7497_012284 [Penicillium chrysogenum]
MPAGKLLVIAPLAALKMLGRDLAADNLDDVILIPYPREYLPTAVPPPIMHNTPHSTAAAALHLP